MNNNKKFNYSTEKEMVMQKKRKFLSRFRFLIKIENVLRKKGIIICLKEND